MEKNKVLEIAKAEVEKLKELLGVDAQVECSVEDGDEGYVVVNVVFEGEDLGYMIGNRGAHLQAMQFVLSNIIKTKLRKETSEEEIKVTVLVDVGGYRQQRADKIEALAMQKADDARILGESVDLLPMSSGDRRIVHTVLGKFDDLKTESFGDGRDRYVRITPISEKELGVVSSKEEASETEE